MIRIILGSFLILSSCISSEKYLKEIQITHDNSKNHDLDNNDNFSPDGKWLVYDTRTPEGGIGGCPSIERVNIETGEVQVLYRLPENRPYGPGVGAVSYQPNENKVIFIHGLQNCSAKNPYQQWRRTGVIIQDDQPDVPVFMDARDVTFPFTPGALRGGTHRHEWRGDGNWIGFTYNNAILKKQEDSTGLKRNLRTIAVSNRQRPPEVEQDKAGENVSGTWYSAVVVRVVPDPEPGSDEISNAASDSWVGKYGYRKSDGIFQVARAFLGKVRDRAGNPVDELFVVDIPDSLNVPGEYGPLEGTRESFPMPPKGTIQRRLTHTADSQFPGCGGVVRSSSDGEFIAYLAKDSNGIQQVFRMAPSGGQPLQLTSHASGVQSGVRWSPDNRSVIYLCDNSIFFCEVSDQVFEKRFRRLTARTPEAPSNLVWSNDGKTIAYNRLAGDGNQVDAKKQIFIIRL